MDYLVPAVRRAVLFLKCVAEQSDGEASLAELCAYAEVPRSSGSNIARTLEHAGLLRVDSVSRKYRLGPLLAELGSLAPGVPSQAERLRGFLVRLEQRTGFTSVLVQMIGNEVMIVDEVSGSSGFQVSAKVGHYYPLHSPAMGCSMLAFQPTGRISQYVESAQASLESSSFPMTPAELTRKLESVRKTGYASSMEEYVAGLSAVASPIFDSSGHARLSVCIVGLTSKLTADVLRKSTLLVRRTAANMTEALGGSWPDFPDGRSHEDLVTREEYRSTLKGGQPGARSPV